MIIFFSSSFLPPWKYNLDMTQEAEIRHTNSTHKNKRIPGVLDDFADFVIGLVEMVWFFFSHIAISAISGRIFML